MKLIYFELVLGIYANIIVFPAAAENHIAASSRTEPGKKSFYFYFYRALEVKHFNNLKFIDIFSNELKLYSL